MIGLLYIGISILELSSYCTKLSYSVSDGTSGNNEISVLPSFKLVKIVRINATDWLTFIVFELGLLVNFHWLAM
jgi:hypothetical protein